MSKSAELKSTTDIVRAVLQGHEKARNSDDYLYYLVCHIYGREYGYDVEHMSLGYFLVNRTKMEMPAFETVRRARQKLQQTYPELSAWDKVEGRRMMNEETFREYARSGV